MSRHDVVKRHDFRSAMKSKEKLSSMKSVRFDGIYNGKEAEVGHGGCVCLYIYICVCMYVCMYIYICMYVCIYLVTYWYVYVYIYICSNRSEYIGDETMAPGF